MESSLKLNHDMLKSISIIVVKPQSNGSIAAVPFFFSEKNKNLKVISNLDLQIFTKEILISNSEMVNSFLVCIYGMLLA
jgi:hypothetical protein